MPSSPPPASAASTDPAHRSRRVPRTCLRRSRRRWPEPSPRLRRGLTLMVDDLRTDAPVGSAALAAALTGLRGPAQPRAVAKAITLLESTRVDHRARADELLRLLLPHAGRSFRLGISGVPGVGKSTFIEALGMLLVGQGHRV